MRVVGGTFRSRGLVAPAGRDVRPTSDRVREALFDILGDRVVRSKFLDLFAGSGAVGIEALSRGTASVVLIESGKPALMALEKNLASLGLDPYVSATPRGVRGTAVRSRESGSMSMGNPQRGRNGVETKRASGDDAGNEPGGTEVEESRARGESARSGHEPGLRLRDGGRAGPAPGIDSDSPREPTSMGVTGVIHVVRTPWPAGITAGAALGGPFSIAFADPPYERAPCAAILESLCGPGVLAPEALVVLEHEVRTGVPDVAGALGLTRIYRYGRTGLAFYTPRMS